MINAHGRRTQRSRAGRAGGRGPSFAERFAWAFRRFAPFFVAGLFLVFLPRQWLRTDTIRDSTAYHEAAQRVVRGVSMYEPHPAPGPHEFTDWYYLYPPLLASALAPAAGMSSLTFLRLWLLLLAGAGVVYAVSLARIADGRATGRGVVVWGAAVGMTGGTAAIGHGNVDMIVFALVGCGIAWAGARGSSFTIAALLKVSPVWPLLVAMRRGGRRVVIGAAIAAALALLVTVVALGPAGTLSETREWFRWALPSVSQGQFWGSTWADFSDGHVSVGDVVGNLSPSFALVQLLILSGRVPYSGGNLPELARAFLSAVGVLAPLLAAWWTRSRSPALQLAVVTCAAMLSGPILRVSYLPILLVPLAVVLGERARERGAEPLPSSVKAGSRRADT